jgi:beta-galactosidase
MMPDRRRSPGGEEVARVGRELEAIGTLPESGQAPVALVLDYEAAWVTRIQPQGADYDYFELMLRWYEAVRRLGLDVDIVAPGASLAGYKLVLAPSLPIVEAATLAALRESDAVLVVGPRAGSKLGNFSIPEMLPPGPLQELMPMAVTQVGSLPPGLRHGVGGALSGSVEKWREWVESAQGEAVARFEDGGPAVLRFGRRLYVGGWPDRILREGMMRLAAEMAGLPVIELGEGVRLRRRGDLRFVFNYGSQRWTVPDTGPVEWLIGGVDVEPQGVACWRASVGA